MEIKELRAKMRDAEKEHDGDYEAIHSEHDELLLEYIDDKIVKKIFNNSPKWGA